MKKLTFLLLVGVTCYLGGIFLGQLIRPSLNSNQPVFIWNDDLEGIPVDSTPILLEFSSKNQDTIYIGTLDGYDKSEYQFTITDDSITVTDFGRVVGTVKVEGQLEQLLIKDNE